MWTKFALTMLLASVVCGAECVVIQGLVQYGRIDVSAYAINGDRLNDVSVELIQKGSKKSLKSAFRGTVASKVPYGFYRLRVYATGFRTFDRGVNLDQPDLSVRVQLAIARECATGAEITGSVQPLLHDRELWVKAIPVHGTCDAEAPIRTEGSFRLSQLNEGAWLLLVLDGEKIVLSQKVQAMGSQKTAVDLVIP